MTTSLADRVFLEEGKEAAAIYDLTSKRVYRINHAAYSLLRSLPRELDGNEFERWQSFLEECTRYGLVVRSTRQNATVSPLAHEALPKPKLDYAWVELTNRCNHRCKHCFVGDQLGEKDVPLDDLVERFRGLRDLGVASVVLTGGEPLLHRQVEAVFESCFALGFTNICVLTNGTVCRTSLRPYLSDDRVSLKVPLFGEATVHDDFVDLPGSHDKVTRNVRTFVQWGVQILLTTTVTKKNRGSVPYIESFARDLNIPVHRTPVFPVGFAKQNWHELVDEYSQIIDTCGETVIGATNQTESRSAGPDYISFKDDLTTGHDCNRSIAIQATGRVTPCLMIRTDSLAAGNLNEEPLIDLVGSESEKYENLRKVFSHEKHGKCQSCEIRFGCQGGGCPARSVFFAGVSGVPVKTLDPKCHYETESAGGEH